MSEPSSAVPGDIELDVDEEKVEAWDEVKADYQVEPDGQAVPNSMAPTDFEPADDEDDDDEQ
ncbi:hypothetical protein [Nostocoides sp. HKS02]|uniref:hypothetical protein n=1 Tax=Nostocoides sp. HKS02 TaxID=1813880 RepID=UPI0012B48FB5|nr:hypothetical protein [Tetrasphaera sp. HKS02]QGN56688.1 hypothetical protein GKE56_00870 [Tetrasphaera sp. HKS02]